MQNFKILQITIAFLLLGNLIKCNDFDNLEILEPLKKPEWIVYHDQKLEISNSSCRYDGDIENIYFIYYCDFNLSYKVRVRVNKRDVCRFFRIPDDCSLKFKKYIEGDRDLLTDFEQGQINRIFDIADALDSSYFLYSNKYPFALGFLNTPRGYNYEPEPAVDHEILVITNTLDIVFTKFKSKKDMEYVFKRLDLSHL